MGDLSAQISQADLDRIGNTLAFYAQALGKDLVDVSNRALRQAAIVASSKTPKVEPAKIEAELLRPVATRVFTRRGQRLKKPKTITRATSLAIAIARSRAKDNGEEISYEEADKRAHKLVAARKRSTRFVRSGYIPALILTKARRTEAGKQIGRPKGTASLATPARIEAMLSNQVQGPKGGLAVQIGADALIAAIPEVERDMRQYAEKKIAERTARLNAEN